MSTVSGKPQSAPRTAGEAVTKTAASHACFELRSPTKQNPEQRNMVQELESPGRVRHRDGDRLKEWGKEMKGILSQ